MKILVTGGAGYIGTHTLVELCDKGHEVYVVDNFINSSPSSLEAVEKIVGKSIDFSSLDLLDREGLDKLFTQNNFDSVIHFAGLKAVGESVQKPLLYYKNNIEGTLNLLSVMDDHNVKKLVFSSSATVYGVPEKSPITEDFPTSATNPYGRTKLFIEEILKDVYTSGNDWSIVILRYFNPIGAHKSGDIGEDPNGIPNNLLPYISQVAVGKLEKLKVFGNDYDTKDGTGVRDYIHVVDLAKGHVSALTKLADKHVNIYNLGSGKGYSVLEVILSFEKACGKEIPYEVVARREGDVATNFADPTKAEKELGWTTEKDLDEMCEDTWRWQSKHPDGFK